MVRTTKTKNKSKKRSARPHCVRPHCVRPHGVRRRLLIDEFPCITCDKKRMVADIPSMVRTRTLNGRYRLSTVCKQCHQRLSKFIPADKFYALEGEVPLGE
jgi:hypothetical protein